MRYYNTVSKQKPGESKFDTHRRDSTVRWIVAFHDGEVVFVVRSNSSFRSQLAHLTTEGRNPSSESIDKLSPLEIVRLMNEEDAKVATAVRKQDQAIARAIEAITDRLKQGGRLIYLGAGTSGRLGVLDAAECPPTFNTCPEMVVGIIAGGKDALVAAIEGKEDHPHFGRQDLMAVALTENDSVVGIATSGRTPYVVGGLQYAQQIGGLAIGFSCNPDPELAAVSDLLITPIVGPEVVSGSTRLKAGTATKMVLNMLTTGAMVCLGKTFGNLMVDLRATNEKLKARSVRILRLLTGLHDSKATSLLDRCNGEVKVAIVCNRRDVEPNTARNLLSEHEGHLRPILDEHPVSQPNCGS